MALSVEVSLLLAGLALLWWAGDHAVRYSLESADILGISSFTVGFLVLSISTGLPEITTAILSVHQQVPGLSAGDILGSSLVNLTLVLGIATVAAGHLSVQRRDEEHLLKILVIITAMTSAILITQQLSVWHGVLLLVSYGASIVFLQRGGLIQRVVEEETDAARKEQEEAMLLKGLGGTILKLLGSLLFVIIGARLTVDSAVSIATTIGIPLETVGATVVAIGTGLPEISLELNAVKRREYALALGDIFGSTLVNLTLILGILSVISPAHINTIPLLGTILYMVLTLGFLWAVMIRGEDLRREHGIVLLLIFLAYLIEEIGVAEVLYIAF